jgi:hypothetical protein
VSIEIFIFLFSSKQLKKAYWNNPQKHTIPLFMLVSEKFLFILLNLEAWLSWNNTQNVAHPCFFFSLMKTVPREFNGDFQAGMGKQLQMAFRWS